MMEEDDPFAEVGQSAPGVLPMPEGRNLPQILVFPASTRVQRWAISAFWRHLLLAAGVARSSLRQQMR
jgi:hypothetical protein